MLMVTIGTEVSNNDCVNVVDSSNWTGRASVLYPWETSVVLSVIDRNGGRTVRVTKFRKKPDPTWADEPIAVRSQVVVACAEPSMRPSDTHINWAVMTADLQTRANRCRIQISPFCLTIQNVGRSPDGNSPRV